MLYCVIIVCITVLLASYGCKMQLNKLKVIIDFRKFFDCQNSNVAIFFEVAMHGCKIDHFVFNVGTSSLEARNIRLVRITVLYIYIYIVYTCHAYVKYSFPYKEVKDKVSKMLKIRKYDQMSFRLHDNHRLQINKLKGNADKIYLL
jgi:hypothetical protein